MNDFRNETDSLANANAIRAAATAVPEIDDGPQPAARPRAVAERV